MASAFENASSSLSAEMRRSCSSNCGVCSPSPQMIWKMILLRYQFIVFSFDNPCGGLEILQFDAAEDAGAVDEQNLFGVEHGRLLPFIFETSENGAHFATDLPVCRDDDLGAAHDLGDIETGGTGEVCLRQIYFASAEDRDDVAAFKILRDDPFMDAGEDAG